MFKERGALKPGHTLAAAHHVVAFERAYWHRVDIFYSQLVGKLAEVGGDALEYFLRKRHQIHFVYGGNDVPNSEQMRDVCVAARLSQNSLGCIHQDHGGFSGGSNQGSFATVAPPRIHRASA